MLRFHPGRDGNILWKYFDVNGAYPNIEDLAKHDGLSFEDWREWFKGYDLSEPLAIIHFTKPFFETIEERLDRLENENRKLRSKVDSQESLLFELQRKVYFLRQRELQRQIDDYLENFTPLSERKKQQKK